MISKREAIPLVLKACPGFQKWWDDMGPLFSERLWQEDGWKVLWVFFTNLTWHLLALHHDQKTEAFTALSQVIERLLVEGEPEIQNISVKDFLESVQCIWNYNHVDPNHFFVFLCPQTAQYLRQVQHLSPFFKAP